MKYYSETLKKVFDTQKELKAAEAEAEAKKAEEAKKVEAKKARAKEVEAAYKHVNEVRKECAVKMEEAYKVFDELREAFIKDYGSFHMSFFDDGEKETVSVSDIISSIFLPLF